MKCKDCIEMYGENAVGIREFGICEICGQALSEGQIEPVVSGGDLYESEFRLVKLITETGNDELMDAFIAYKIALFVRLDELHKMVKEGLSR